MFTDDDAFLLWFGLWFMFVAIALHKFDRWRQKREQDKLFEEWERQQHE